LTTRTEDSATTTVETVADRDLTPFSEVLEEATGSAGPDALSLSGLPLLRERLGDIASLTRPREFPEFFARFAEQTGLRMLLLKRWTSGLQVFMETNMRVPPEARRRAPDGRAPIPTAKNDLFQACGEDAAVYAGPVPAKHFPLDLTLMLGRGSRDRQIVILPLSSKDHWNTFVYLDAGKASGRALELAEILARFALARMITLSSGFNRDRGRVASILKAERQRRRQHAAKRQVPAEKLPVADPWGDGAGEAPATPDAAAPATDPTPGPVQEIAADLVEQVLPRTSEQPLSRAPDVDPFAGSGAAAGAADPPSAHAGPLTPELILRHSGELPALPRAACHIMAVIEDPKTTATGLEKALAMDQALTAKVLRIANSPFYGAVREIRTVSEAVVRLGFVAIRNWTLVAAARSVFLAPGAGMLYQRIWKQSVLSAMSAQLVAQVVGGREPESVFIGGLMQNIGQLVLARSHPELFHEILAESADSGRSYHEVEQEMLGFDHGELGALLISEWNLSPELEDAVRWHHRYDHEDARNNRMAAMIALGEEIALCSWAADAAEDEDAGPGPSAPAKFLGLPEGRVRDLYLQANDLHIDPHFFS
jgi:HD-like signal output (HDOD) protein